MVLFAQNPKYDFAKSYLENGQYELRGAVDLLYRDFNYCYYRRVFRSGASGEYYIENENKSTVTAALVLVITPELASTVTGVIILGAIATNIDADQIVDDLGTAFEWMKQWKRDRDYDLPPALFDWYHNGGGKTGHMGQDIGSKYGPNT